MNVTWATPPQQAATPGQGTMRRIAERVAQERGLTLADLKGPARPRILAHARQDAMAEIYALGRFSMPQIGRFFGGRDHTTVLHGIRQVAARKVERASAA